MKALWDIIKTCVEEAEIPNNEITKEDNIKATHNAIIELFNVCETCGRVHSDGTRNNCV
jgi:hypothetical protein